MNNTLKEENQLEGNQNDTPQETPETLETTPDEVSPTGDEKVEDTPE